MWKKRKCLPIVLGVLLLLLSIGSCAALSRRGYAEAEQYHIHGFYYFSPEDSDAWRLKNYGCAYLFWPINAAERWLGLGRFPASEPLMSFVK